MRKVKPFSFFEPEALMVLVAGLMALLSTEVIGVSEAMVDLRGAE